jgi:type I restriction enzyme M protein
LFGAIIGDIVGSRFEFDDLKSKDFNLFGNDGITPVRCQFTDDSVMTIAVAETLLDREAGESDKAFKQRLIINMHYHGRKRMNAGYGTQFYCWLRDAKTEPYNSWGNGSAMRVAPVGWAADTLEETAHLAALSAEVTHNHPEGVKGAQAVAAAIWLARNGYDKEEIRRHVEQQYYPDAFAKTLDEIRPGFEFDVSCQGTVPPALEAFYEADSFTDALKNAVSLGGDSDTLAAITGSVAEAYYGIPDPIRREAMTFLDDEMRDIAVRFQERFQQ